MDSALQALVRALTDGAAGPVGQEVARGLAQFLASAESPAPAPLPPPLRDRLRELLSTDVAAAQAVGAALEKVRPGTGAWVRGDQIDFDGLFLGDVTGSVLHQHFHPAPQTAESSRMAVGSLPPATPSFTGREELLEQLDGFLEPNPGMVTATVLAGMAGVGKTALATEAAHVAKGKGWFPGGFLFIDLHGYDHASIAVEQALGTLLEDLGTPAEHLSSEQRVKHYRTQLDRWPDRVLIFADNAASVEQVRLLLPADTRHRILITSRIAIPQLGARQMLLKELSPQAAVALLDQALRLANGSDCRITVDAAAATELAGLCGHLPLALQIAAAQLVWDPDKPVAEAAAELRDQSTRLAFLDDGERSVRAAFELSYHRLTAEQARLLRLLAEAPGPETGAETLTALLGGAPSPAVLTALERAYLVDRSSSRTEWRLHDLVRVFAGQVSADDPSCVAEREAARERVLEHYLTRADAADNHLRGTGSPGCFTDLEEALTWLDREQLGLLASVEWGETDRYTARTLDLALCVTEYLRRRGLFEEVVTVNTLAQQFAAGLGDQLREAAAWENIGDAQLSSERPAQAAEAFGRAGDLHRSRGDRVGEAAQWNKLAIAESLLGRRDQAIAAFLQARDLRKLTGDLHGEAMTLNNLAIALGEVGRVEEALEAFTGAADILVDLGDRLRASEAFRNLGNALKSVGREVAANDAFARGRAIMPPGSGSPKAPSS
ncbi:tetratricopeptide repeat protein [Streptomyces sp. NPDC126514]|uniref:tetratricopeptide repeat protein n=1 Tax=Streptomyces sp. NPDC126514 TaxID=3155210 RepID=UPI0033253A1B